ncbi:rhomboid family intramembrane serine protease [Halolamina litorea]|uniref:Rhomboid family intramembrane serine protease n=1 Tax=Halolamina litorea TaxID=1515593 RepID=A0ABD6BP63_9EURY|nr:rhomboid family intramembrane serine protease [Halolamina litorea]
MATCDVCGKQENMPYECRRCGGTFCSEHRLPENHDCPGLQWDDPVGLYDDDTGGGRSGGAVGNVRDRATSTWRSYFRGNTTFVFLLAMWVTWVTQIALRLVAPELEATLFVLRSSHPEYVWTWFTSVFAHGGIVHIVTNSIGIFFFGQVVERRLGSKRFAALFLASGAIAGLAQIGATILLVGPDVSVGVVGASGALLAIMGVLTILNPGLTVYLYFLLPVPIWLLTIGFAAFSLLQGFGVAEGGGNVAHWAHLAGLAVGLLYGTYVQGKVEPPQRLQFGGGGPGGPGRRGGGRF